MSLPALDVLVVRLDRPQHLRAPGRRSTCCPLTVWWTIASLRSAVVARGARAAAGLPSPPGRGCSARRRRRPLGVGERRRGRARRRPRATVRRRPRSTTRARRPRRRRRRPATPARCGRPAVASPRPASRAPRPSTKGASNHGVHVPPTRPRTSTGLGGRRGERDPDGLARLGRAPVREPCAVASGRRGGARLGGSAPGGGRRPRSSGRPCGRAQVDVLGADAPPRCGHRPPGRGRDDEHGASATPRAPRPPTAAVDGDPASRVRVQASTTTRRRPDGSAGRTRQCPGRSRGAARRDRVDGSVDGGGGGELLVARHRRLPSSASRRRWRRSGPRGRTPAMARLVPLGVAVKFPGVTSSMSVRPMMAGRIEERHQVHHLDERVEGRAGGVLERVAHGVGDDGGLVGRRSPCRPRCRPRCTSWRCPTRHRRCSGSWP